MGDTRSTDHVRPTAASVPSTRQHEHRAGTRLRATVRTLDHAPSRQEARRDRWAKNNGDDTEVRRCPRLAQCPNSGATATHERDRTMLLAVDVPGRTGFSSRPDVAIVIVDRLAGSRSYALADAHQTTS